MRLIDADALRQQLLRCVFRSGEGTAELMQAGTVLLTLAAAPTVSCGIPSCAAHPKAISPPACQHVWVESETTLAGWVCRKCNEWRAS